MAFSDAAIPDFIASILFLFCSAQHTSVRAAHAGVKTRAHVTNQTQCLAGEGPVVVRAPDLLQLNHAIID